MHKKDSKMKSLLKDKLKIHGPKCKLWIALLMLDNQNKNGFKSVTD